MKKFVWFLSGIMVCCVLGATKVEVDYYFGKTLNCTDSISLGQPGKSKILLNVTPGEASILVESPNGQVQVALIAKDDGNAYLVAITPKGQKVTKLSK